MRDRWSRMFAVAVSALLAITAAADVRIVTWNVREGFTPDAIHARASDFSDFFEELRPDIILLQEITSIEVVEQIVIEFGEDLEDWHIAVSRFDKVDGTSHSSFEVAIVSRFPLSEIAEFDPFPGENEAGDPTELTLDPVGEVGVESVNTSRGFVRAHVPSLGLSLISTHLKSSLGRTGSSDASNAKKRELVAAAIAIDLAAGSGGATDGVRLVAGDFNVGCADAAKNGDDLDEDCFSGACDRYDDTHALLGGGLVPGVEFVNIVLPFSGTSTMPSFGGSPIDNIYVSDPDHFGDTEIMLDTFGSDHRPVLTVLRAETPSDGAKAQLLNLVAELEARIAELRAIVEDLPN